MLLAPDPCPCSLLPAPCSLPLLAPVQKSFLFTARQGGFIIVSFCSSHLRLIFCTEETFVYLLHICWLEHFILSPLQYISFFASRLTAWHFIALTKSSLKKLLAWVWKCFNPYVKLWQCCKGENIYHCFLLPCRIRPSLFANHFFNDLRNYFSFHT